MRQLVRMTLVRFAPQLLFSLVLMFGLSPLLTPLLAAGDGEHAKTPAVFRFHLSVEPGGLDPAKLTSSESNYFLFNVLRGLMKVDTDGNVQPELAERCTWKSGLRVLVCRVKKTARWSDGKPIRAQDFVWSWRRLVAPESKGVGVTLLEGVENAFAIHKGEKSIDQLGIRAINDREVEIRLAKDDREFPDRLAHPALAVVREGGSYDRASATSAPISGPYKVAKWQGGRIRLENNPHYNTHKRPPIEILVIDEDETALNLYREGTLTFLRRLPTHYLKSWRGSKELYQIPVSRFDYIGFGPGLRAALEFRQALAAALDYKELQVLYDALGTPGCPSLDPRLMKTVSCHHFSKERAQALWAKVPGELKTKRWTLKFSKLGGDDIQKGMEWAQQQWKKNLGLTVDIQGVEQGVYLQELKNNTPDIFRKGVGLDRPTCLAALEIFSKGHPENYLRLDLPEFENALVGLKNATSPKARAERCTKATAILLERAEIIPLGQIHFSMLAKPQFKGWVLNSLNQLDLSNLDVWKPSRPDLANPTLSQ